MSISLKIAALYNILWGSWVVLFPDMAFDLIELERPNYPQIWQCVGMIVGVYGIGYWIASWAPIKHWPITLVGLLGKLFGPLGFLFAALTGDLPWSFGLIIIFNDLIWWPSFVYILRNSYREFNQS